MDANTAKNVKKLQEELRYCRKKYYVYAEPVISDFDFDLLQQKLLDYQKQYPEIVDEVGYRSDSASYIHKHPMLSLRSTPEIMTVSASFVKVPGTISCEPKIDGLSIELVYRGSKISAAATRGDGEIGDDVTRNIMKLYSVSQTINDMRDIEIYGEIYLTKKNFIKINRERLRLGQSLYSSPRNAASGITRSTNSDKFLQYLSFFPYTLIGTDAETQADCFRWLEQNGFNILDELTDIVDDDPGIYDYQQRITKLRPKLPFEIDGLVFKLNNIALRDELGMSRTHPNWAIAYKFSPDLVSTRLTDVIFQVGKSGIIAPVAILDKVKILNSNVTRALLANESVIAKKDIRIGDIVHVGLMNDVIPKITGVSVEDRCGKEIPIVFPTECPSCNGPLTKIDQHWMCTSSNCPAQLLGRINAAVGRYGFNIKGLGSVIIKKLIDSGKVKNLADIFTLNDPDKLNEWSGCGLLNARKICYEINNARRIPLHKFIFALGIPDVSIATSVKLAERYGILEHLIDYINMHGVAKLENTDAQTYVFIEEYFGNRANIDMITKLEDNGVVVEDCDTKRLDKKYTITGTLSIPRADIESKMTEIGFKRNDQVSKNVEFLICGTNPSNLKIEAAKRLNIPILSDAEFITKFGGEI